MDYPFLPGAPQLPGAVFRQQDGKCEGYQRGYLDDEICDTCKTCKLNEFYEN